MRTYYDYASGFHPNNFFLTPTAGCNAHCRYCFVSHKCDDLMTAQTFRKAAAFMERIADASKEIHVTFHGGEPTLAGVDWYAMVLPALREQFGRRIRFSIQSNLHAVTDDMAELFRQYGVHVGTSLDGPEDMCCAQRGEGYYDKTKTGERLMNAHGIGVGKICTFSPAFANRAAQVYREAETPYAIHGAVPSIGQPANEWSVSCDQMRQILLDSYEAYKADPAHCRITTIDSMARSCLVGKGRVCTFFNCLGRFCTIAPNGDLYTCERFLNLRQFCLGNVNDDVTEEDILDSGAYATLSACVEGMRDACGSCAHWAYCQGGCLYNTLAGQADKDPYCEAYKAAFDTIALDMAKDMAAVLCDRDAAAPVLAMAGDRPHPYIERMQREHARGSAAGQGAP